MSLGRPDVHIDLHLVLLRAGCVLMGRRRNTAFAAGQYQVPGGRLEPDETILISARDGSPLLAIEHGENGPALRLMGADLDLDIGGDLRLSARQIELRAREGEARIEASHDVVVEGEAIHLN